MKKIFILFAVIISTISCSKTVSEQQEPKQEQAQLTRGESSFMESKVMIGDLDSADLRLEASPRVLCYGYEDGEQEKPCTISIDFAVTLSKPVNSYIQVEVERNIAGEKDKPLDGVGGVVEGGSVNDPGAHTMIRIPPNTTRYVFNSTLSNANNNNIPDTEFRIVSVSLYDPKD